MVDLERHRSSFCCPRFALSPSEPYHEPVDQHTKKKDERTSCSLTKLCMSTSSDTHFFMSLVTVLKDKCRTERWNYSLITLIIFFFPFLLSFFTSTSFPGLITPLLCFYASAKWRAHVSGFTFPWHEDIAVLSFAGHELQSHYLQQNQTPFQIMCAWLGCRGEIKACN